MSGTADRDDPAPVLALVRAVGLPGFTAGDGRPAPSGIQHNVPRSTAEGNPTDTLALVRAVGLSGFTTSDDSPAAPGTDVGTVASPPIQLAPASADRNAAPQTPTVRLGRRERIVLRIAPGSEGALAELEARMGRPFAADRCGEPYWFGGNVDGHTVRAFDFMPSQLSTIAGVLGELGVSGLTLSVGRIPTTGFAVKGPGATAHLIERGTPPQLPPDLPKAVRSALGR